MIYDKRREINIEFETYIHRGEIEIPINVTGEFYSGSHADDDPSEFIVDSCVVAEDTECEDGKKPDFVQGQKLKLTEQEEREVEYKYLKTHEN